MRPQLPGKGVRPRLSRSSAGSEAVPHRSTAAEPDEWGCDSLRIERPDALRGADHREKKSPSAHRSVCGMQSVRESKQPWSGATSRNNPSPMPGGYFRQEALHHAASECHSDGAISAARDMLPRGTAEKSSDLRDLFPRQDCTQSTAARKLQGWVSKIRRLRISIDRAEPEVDKTSHRLCIVYKVDPMSDLDVRPRDSAAPQKARDATGPRSSPRLRIEQAP